MSGPSDSVVRSVDRTWSSLVHQADPDMEREKRNEIEYKFSRRTFTADRSKRFPYDQD